MIRQRTLAGLDKDGNPLAAYSPIYALFKAKRYPQQGGRVTMSATGAMLRSLAVLKVSDDTVTIGSDNTEDALKLLWHNATGAGRSRILRIILGISEEEGNDETLIEILTNGIVIEGSFL